MKDKVVVLTGATGGIGSATAKKYAEAGAKLAIQSTKQEKLDAMLKDLNLGDDKVIGFVLNITDENAVKNMIEQTIAKFGRIDVLINNAGYESVAKSIVDLSAEELMKTMDINLCGVFYGTKYAAKQMIEQKSGAIVNTASIAALRGDKQMAAYISSKHAVYGFTRCAALELAEHGIRVNAVAPGPVDNRMMRSLEDSLSGGADPDGVKNAFTSAIPLGRYVTNEEVANLIYFLSSDEASSIVGEIVRVDGGLNI